MIVLGELCGLPKEQLATSFGFKTRKSYYDCRNAVLKGTQEDLLPKRRGPHTPPKRTKDVEALIIRTRFETDLNMYEIADTLTQMGFSVSVRLVGQVLAHYGLSKKKERPNASPRSTPGSRGD
jgi:transposase